MKRHVPFTSVSIDPDIQRMGDEEEHFSIAEDGSIISNPIMPKCCVSGAHSVSQLISKMRYGTCLWEKRFIRKMNEFHFEQKFEGWGKRAIDMTRQSEDRILISWTKEDGAEKKWRLMSMGGIALLAVFSMKLRLIFGVLSDLSKSIRFTCPMAALTEKCRHWMVENGV